MPILAGPLKGTRWVVGTAPHGAWLGRLERQGLTWAVNAAPPGSTFWDVGANVGLYTLAFSRAAGSVGKVYAFEPAPENVAALRRHLALNNVANVEIVEAAVGEVAGTLRMAPGEFNSEFHVEANGTVEVSAVSLDEWRAAMRSSLPAAVKIDVEGYETEVLRGAERSFREGSPVVFIAIHGERQHADCHRLLRTWGYEVRDTQGQRTVDESWEWLAWKPGGA